MVCCVICLCQSINSHGHAFDNISFKLWLALYDSVILFLKLQNCYANLLVHGS